MGIVTNKRARFTDPLVAALYLSQRAACVVSGDDPETKPSPLPILHACHVLGRHPGQRSMWATTAATSLPVGPRDKTAAAAYGYLGDSGPLELWNGTLS